MTYDAAVRANHGSPEKVLLPNMRAYVTRKVTATWLMGYALS